MIKRTICLCFSVIFLLISAFSANAYADVPEDLWYSEAVSFVTAQGWMEGTGADRFDPEATVTRGMAVTVLWRMAGSPEEEFQYAIYADLPEELWYAKAASWAYPEIMVGYPIAQEDPPVPTGLFLTFEGEQTLTREQLAVVLYRYHNLEQEDAAPAEALTELFPDGSLVSPWAKDAVNWCIEQGLLQGDGQKLNPQGQVTRAQLALVLMRYSQL